MTNKQLTIFFLFMGVLAFQLVTLGVAQTGAVHYFELGDLGTAPGVIKLSPDFQTLIEFEGVIIDEVSSGRTDQITAELAPGNSVIRVRANQAVVKTDLTVSLAGHTALFILESDPTISSPMRYIVRNTPLPSAQPQTSAAVTNGYESAVDYRQAAPAATEVSTGADTSTSLDFQTSVSYAPGGVIIQYGLVNGSAKPVINDPLQLDVFYGSTKLPYKLSRILPPGRPNQLSAGESEFGTIIVTGIPGDIEHIELAWTLVEIGSGQHHTLSERLAARSSDDPSHTAHTATAAPIETDATAPYSSSSPSPASHSAVTNSPESKAASPSETLSYSFLLAGENLVPAIDTTATGLAEATLHGNKLNITGSFEGLMAETFDIHGTPAHMHAGQVGQNGDILLHLEVDLNPGGRSGTFSGSKTLTADELVTFKAGGYYIVVHSEAYNAGELRGQVSNTPIPRTTDYTVLLSGDAQVPPTPSSATGLAKVILAGKTLTIEGAVSGLSSDLNAAQGSAVNLSYGKPGQTGPIFYSLEVRPDPDGRGGRFSFSQTLPDDDLAVFEAGNFYLSVATETYKDGELRAQLRPQKFQPLEKVQLVQKEIPSQTSYANAYGDAEGIYNATYTRSALEPSTNADSDDASKLYGDPQQSVNASVNTAEGAGTGLAGEYFKGKNFEMLLMWRLDEAVDFSWAAPYNIVADDGFSARWRGQVRPFYGGEHSFYVVSDGGVRLWIDGQKLIDDWDSSLTRENKGTVELEAGQMYEVVLEYVAHEADAQLSLSWESTLHTREVIPTHQLYPEQRGEEPTKSVNSDY